VLKKELAKLLEDGRDVGALFGHLAFAELASHLVGQERRSGAPLWEALEEVRNRID
jgi:hypothetical protein